MRAHQADFPVFTMCRVLKVFPSGYYAWLKRPPSGRTRADAVLKARVEQIHPRSRGTYGAPRIRAELAEEGRGVSRKRIARLMLELGVRGVCGRRRISTTRRSRQGRVASDLVNRVFSASGPNLLWGADITCLPTGSGFLYLSVVVDARSRRVVGWAMASHLRTQMVLDALDMALYRRRPHSVIHHSAGVAEKNTNLSVTERRAMIEVGHGPSILPSTSPKTCSNEYIVLPSDLHQIPRGQATPQCKVKSCSVDMVRPPRYILATP